MTSIELTHQSSLPPLNQDQRSVLVGVTLPSKQFDALCKRARREDVSVPEIIRRDLMGRRLRTP